MRSILIATAAILPLAACVSMTENPYEPTVEARAVIGDFGAATLTDTAGTIIGKATLTQGATGLLIQVEASGLRPGAHGLHIHGVGRCDAPFTSAGGHINHTTPATPHGLLNALGPDDGDLPNVFADASGKVRADVFTTRARIAAKGPGQYLWDADGAALVIHESADDYLTPPIGGAGARVACGVLAAG